MKPEPEAEPRKPRAQQKYAGSDDAFNVRERVAMRTAELAKKEGAGKFRTPRA